MNRTYQIGLFYANPKSPWRFGVGRLILPWASSLGAIDGGYAARKVSRKVTVGMFAGTNPDPTQWNYAPNRQTVGSFVNYRNRQLRRRPLERHRRHRIQPRQLASRSGNTCSSRTTTRSAGRSPSFKPPRPTIAIPS